MLSAKMDVLISTFAIASYAIIAGNLYPGTAAANAGAVLFILLASVFFYLYLLLEFEED